MLIIDLIQLFIIFLIEANWKYHAVILLYVALIAACFSGAARGETNDK